MADRHLGGTTGLRERTRSSPLGNLVVLAVVTALILGGAWWMNRGGSGEGTAVEVPASAGPAPALGEPAPDFAALTTAGERVSRSDLEGQPVWLSFVATWCASCRSEAVDVEAAAVAAGGQIEVVSIYLGEDEPTVATYAQRLGLTHAQVPDPDKTLSSRYRVMSIPTHVFLDAEGRIQSTHVGVMTRAAMDDAIDGVLAASRR